MKIKIKKKINDINMILLLKDSTGIKTINSIPKDKDTYVILNILSYLFLMDKTYKLELVLNKIPEKVYNLKTELKQEDIKTFKITTFSLSSKGYTTLSMEKEETFTEVGFSEGSGSGLNIHFDNFNQEAGRYEFYIVCEGKVLGICPFNVE